LVNLLSSALGAVERADAGRLLAKLGDPRQEVLDVDAMCFCFVPAGSFCMGSERQTDPDAYDDEEPQHSLDLPSFWISQYPVTQAQFAQFVQAGGYGRAEFWEEAAKDQHWEGGGVIRRIFDGSKFINETANQPFDYGEPFGLSNHPVVGVTWYEALAFTRWLEERWQIKRKIPTGWKVCLPSEAEWEKASRGGLHILTQPNLRTMDLSFMQKEGSLQDNPHLARRYPWGDIFDPNNANMADTGIGTTSAVGCFASGASPYGVQDMSGNVWEWTRSLWGKKWEKADYRYPYKSTDGRESLEAPDSSLRVLRGGAFDFYSGGVRCAFRHWGSPYFRINSLGFRVVVSPSAPGL
jgi:formylglycine-generating enzyme required for sulfatase activity